MKIHLFKKTIFLIILFSFLIPFSIEAITIENPIEAETFEEIIENLINFIFGITVAIVPIMCVIAAFYFITSGGDQNKIRTAKKIFFYTMIGFFIVLMARGIAAMIKQVLGMS